MGGELEIYQQALDGASQPVFARLEQYRKVMQEVRKLLKDYFFNTTRTQKLTEATQTDETVFNFNSVKEAMEACLPDEEFLLAAAQEVRNPAGHPSLVAAFAAQISRSTLPLEFQDEHGSYMFNPQKPYTPMAQIFMQQFAYALSVYHVCLGVYETYYALSNHEGIHIQALKNYIEAAQSIKQQAEGNEVNLLALHQHTKTIKKEIMSQLRTEKIYAGITSFKEDVDTLSTQLVAILEFGAVHLQKCYKEFPNDAILWMLHDRSWHALLKTISGLLYADQYTYSTLYGTLEIKKEFISLIKSEIDHFSEVAFTKTPLLKIELLRKAADLITKTKTDLMAELAKQGIELVEAPIVGMFSTAPTLKPRSNIYELMAAYYSRASQVVVNEDESSEEFYPHRT